MSETLRQKFRLPFGFYMETLVAKNFRLKGIFEMYHEHCNAYEWNIDENKFNLFKNMVEALDINLEEEKNKIIDILNGQYKTNFTELYIKQRYYGPFCGFESKFSTSFAKYFSLHDSEQKFERKLIIYEASKLVCSNRLEFVRIENGNLIISEIKSQYGPTPDYRIEFSERQLEIFTKLTSKRIKNSVIYCISLPGPRFIEISFSEFYEQFRQWDAFNGKEFTTNDWGGIRVRIPHKYRDSFTYNCIEKSLYNYNDNKSLFKAILNEYPHFNDRLGNIP